jgi:anti-sigma regulatory factor (Ser/Thr protein kinase)
MNQEITLLGRTFAQLFSSTRRGARLACLLALHQLDTWGVPYGSALSERAGLVVTEPAANAVLHGRVAGRDFQVRLAMPGALGPLRIEVCDARTHVRPDPDRVTRPHPLSECGRGLVLVDELTEAWGVTDRHRAPGKTVWAEL